MLKSTRFLPMRYSPLRDSSHLKLRNSLAPPQNIIIMIFLNSLASPNLRGFIPWMFEPEISNLNPLGPTFQVTSTVAYSVKEVGQM